MASRLSITAIRLKYSDDGDINDNDDVGIIRDKYFAYYTNNDINTNNNDSNNDRNEETVRLSSLLRCPVNGCQVSFSSYNDLDIHISSHTNQCHECSRIYPSKRLLDIHLDEAHSSYFNALSLRKPSYVCLVDGCHVVSLSDQHRYDHLVNDHMFPKDTIFYHPTRKYTKKKVRNNNNDNDTTTTEVEMIHDNSSSNDNNNDNNNNDNSNSNGMIITKKPKQCRFYLTVRGCRAGDSCIYAHDNTSNKGNSNSNNNDNNNNDNDMDIDELTNTFQKKLTIPKISFGRKNRHLGFK
jgi:hypothetical protein